MNRNKWRISPGGAAGLNLDD